MSMNVHLTVITVTSTPNAATLPDPSLANATTRMVTMETAPDASLTVCFFLYIYLQANLESLKTNSYHYSGTFYVPA